MSDGDSNNSGSATTWFICGVIAAGGGAAVGPVGWIVLGLLTVGFVIYYACALTGPPTDPGRGTSYVDGKRAREAYKPPPDDHNH